MKSLLLNYQLLLAGKRSSLQRKMGPPIRNEIVFISPTGEEIKTKRQLELYLKTHPAGPSALEFDWGTGDTLRCFASENYEKEEDISPIEGSKGEE